MIKERNIYKKVPECKNIQSSNFLKCKNLQKRSILKYEILTNIITDLK